MSLDVNAPVATIASDDLRRLRRMKLIATGFLTAAAAIYACTFIGTTGGHGVVGFVRAGSEAAMVGGLAHSGRVIFAAAGVMVAVFFTFALQGPLPPKEMGIILGVAVLLDAALVRLLLLPVLLRLAGRWAWWLPRPLARVLPKVEFGH